jgi:hypothetical protein
LEVAQPVQKRAKLDDGGQIAAAVSVAAVTPLALDFSGKFQCKYTLSAPWEVQLPPVQHPPAAHDRTNFTKGCKFSPDGSCVLVASEDAHLRVITYDDVSLGGVRLVLLNRFLKCARQPCVEEA